MTSPNPLVAPEVDAPVSPWAGVWLAEDVEQILSGVRGGSWVDASIGGASAGMDALALVVDPAGTLLQYGVAWLLEHVKPLSEALDWLAGDPGAIAAQAQTWRNVAGAIDSHVDELIRGVRWDTSEWIGEAGDAYRAWAGNQQQALTALATAARTMAAAVEGAGTLIAGVRVMVRDAIAVVVSRLITYAVEEIFSLGAGTPAVVTQVTALCSAWGDRIAHWLRALLDSLRRLRGLTDQLTEALEAIKKLLRRLADRPAEPKPATLNRVRGRGAGNAQYFRLEAVRAIADKYGIDISGLSISLAPKTRRGRHGLTRPDGSIVLYSPGFKSEEDLARTIFHEKFHHDELASGKPYPTSDEVAEEWEDRAYAREDEWWDNQPIRPEPRKK